MQITLFAQKIFICGQRLADVEVQLSARVGATLWGAEDRHIPSDACMWGDLGAYGLHPICTYHLKCHYMVYWWAIEVQPSFCR